MENLGKNIRTLRKFHGLTQQQFADKLGTYNTRVSELENGVRDVTVKELQAISELFSCDLGYLVKFEARIATHQTLEWE